MAKAPLSLLLRSGGPKQDQKHLPNLSPYQSKCEKDSGMNAWGETLPEPSLLEGYDEEQ